MSYNKFYLYKKQVSYDDGITWEDVIPLEQVPSGDPIGSYETLEECEGVPPTPVQYRWVNLDPAVDYYCSGTTKYYKQKKQVSYDGGATWEDVVPAEYQWGGIAQTQSTDCGYVPPTGLKFKATYSGGQTYSAECTSQNETLTQGDVKPSGYQYSAMTEAIIGDCVTTIGEWAFLECRGLTNVTIPNSVTNIDGTAFAYCTSLTSLTIPDNVTSIGKWAFINCTSLTSCTIGTGVTTIGAKAFGNCWSLTSVTINATTPPTLENIDAFEATNNCPIYVPCQSLDAYKTAWSDYASRIQCINPPQPGATTAITYYSPSKLNVTLSAFTPVATAETFVNGIGWLEFATDVTTIGDSAFKDKTAMTEVIIPDSVTSIDSYAFGHCSGLTSITIPNSVTTIGSWAFTDCYGLTSITIPDSVTTIGGGAFHWCRGLQSIVIPDGVRLIYDYTFDTCSALASVTIPSSVTGFGLAAFSHCTSLTSITIPSGVTYIGNQAFTDCYGLTSITVEATTPPRLQGPAVFHNTNSCPIYVPAESVDAYRHASYWAGYGTRIQAIP